MPAVDAHEKDEVPVDRRVLGLDRRTVPMALVVVAVFLVMTVVVPRIDRAIAWNDPIVAGDQLALTKQIAVVPAPGWSLERGYRVVGDDLSQNGPATLVSSGVVVEFATDKFSGTARELLLQVETLTKSAQDPSFQARGNTDSVTTASGVVGVRQSYSSSSSDGRISAFVIDGVGVTATAYGSPAQLLALGPAVDQMVASISSDTPKETR